jgi:hypothetical protein
MGAEDQPEEARIVTLNVQVVDGVPPRRMDWNMNKSISSLVPRLREQFGFPEYVTESELMFDLPDHDEAVMGDDKLDFLPKDCVACNVRVAFYLSQKTNPNAVSWSYLPLEEMYPLLTAAELCAFREALKDEPRDECSSSDE